MLLLSSVGSNQFLNFIVVAEEEENQVRRCRDENESQPVIQADPALENRLGEAADADARMPMRPSPVLKNLIDRIADFLTPRLRLGAKNFKQLFSDLCLQGELRCLR
jgi:hypothetical protein